MEVSVHIFMVSGMNKDRLRCAEAALATIPMPERYLRLEAAQLVDQEGGHDFHNGAHMGWAWGEDAERGVFLDFLWEHRMTNLRASRFFADGSHEGLPAPVEMYPVHEERKYMKINNDAYDFLRKRGLLPPFGENLVSQDVNEFLRRGGDPEQE
jgi:hypothetical protein